MSRQAGRWLLLRPFPRLPTGHHRTILKVGTSNRRSLTGRGGIRAAWSPGEIAAYARLRLFIDRAVSKYRDQRNNPGSNSTSRLSPYLAFGEISPRQVWHAVLTAAEAAGQSDMGEAYLREIAWRKLSYHLLFHFPDLPEKAFRPEFEKFPWANDTALWCVAARPYRLPDRRRRHAPAWHTGWMHNRVRMIVASFLVKDLHQHWIGRAVGWDTLVDADLANNSSGGNGRRAAARTRRRISVSSIPCCRARSLMPGRLRACILPGAGKTARLHHP